MFIDACRRIQSLMVEQEQKSVREVKIVVDTNIIFSALLSPNGTINKRFFA